MTEMLKRLELFNSNRPIDCVRHWRDEGWLLVDPPYQRGDVWGVTRRRNLIRSLIQHIPIPSIIINDRMKADWPEDDWFYAVIDGKQRLTTILKFLDSCLGVPGSWFGEPRDYVLFEDLPVVKQRKFTNAPLAFSEGILESLEDERLVFELVNFGGVPQGETDLEATP